MTSAPRSTEGAPPLVAEALRRARALEPSVFSDDDDAAPAPDDDALHQGLNDPSPRVRLAAMLALARRDAALRSELHNALGHSEPAVVAGAARVLGMLGDSNVVPALLAALRTDDSTVAAAVCRALGRLGDARAIPWLVALVEQGIAPAAALHALGAQDAEALARANVLPVAVAELDDNDPLVRAAACRVLARSGVASLPRLEQALTDGDRRVRLAAAVALWELSERGDALVDAVAREGGR